MLGLRLVLFRKELRYPPGKRAVTMIPIVGLQPSIVYAVLYEFLFAPGPLS